MSQSYTKSCMFCKHEIVMSDKGAGKWLPYDLNGSVHECKTQNQTGTKKVETAGNFADMNGQPTMYTLYEKMQKILAEVTDINQYVKERLK